MFFETQILKYPAPPGEGPQIVSGLENLASIGRMVSFVAHEIRNPLQNIRIGIDIMRMEIGGDPAKLETLEHIDCSVNALTTIVEELLDYSKPVCLRFSMLPVRDIVLKALSASGNKLFNVTVHVELNDAGREIFVDFSKMVQVLVNLISNAADAMPEGGELRIASSAFETEEGSMLRLSVSDTGCGIAEEDLERIQQPFVTTKAHGVGLGIPICKKILDAHNGSLKIKSKVGEGTTAEVTLPVLSL